MITLGEFRGFTVRVDYVEYPSPKHQSQGDRQLFVTIAEGFDRCKAFNGRPIELLISDAVTWINDIADAREEARRIWAQKTQRVAP